MIIVLLGFIFTTLCISAFAAKLKKDGLLCHFSCILYIFHFKDLSAFSFKVAVKHLQRSPYLKFIYAENLLKV